MLGQVKSNQSQVKIKSRFNQGGKRMDEVMLSW